MTGLAVLAGLDDVVLVVGDALVATPTRFDDQCLDVRRHTEGEAHARRHQRLVVRCVDLVERVVLGFYTAGRARKLGARLVERRRPLILKVAAFLRSRRGLDQRPAWFQKALSTSRFILRFVVI